MSLMTGFDNYITVSSKSSVQMRTLISIINTPYTITITDNTFTTNTVSKGLIYIESQHRSNPILMAANTFTSNAAYYGTVGIFIR